MNSRKMQGVGSANIAYSVPYCKDVITAVRTIYSDLHHSFPFEPNPKANPKHGMTTDHTEYMVLTMQLPNAEQMNPDRVP